MGTHKKYIYDFLTRFTHAGIAGCSLLLYLTANLAHLFYESGSLSYSFWMAHVILGHLLIFFLAIRIFWFFKGPRYSRLSNLIKIKEWKQIFLNCFQVNKNFKIKWPWGHHPLASVAYLLVFVALIILTITGLFLTRIQFDLGIIAESYYDDMTILDSFKDPHQLASLFIINFSLVHILMLLWHQRKDKLPILQSMVTGYQYKKPQSGESEDEDN
ncbi:MAG: cytochrome b/b6 domain-containing protein [Bacteriovorax sp.]|nr:cytochrome b/b6 domain-containing protein [Bacteriovorax sp.]